MRIFSTALGLFFTLFSAPLAQAALGIPLPESEIPVQVCAIKFFQPSGELEEVCSATLLSPRRLHSAGHCFFQRSFGAGVSAPSRHEVICPNGQSAQISLVTNGAKFSELGSRQDPEMRRFDSAVIELDRDVQLPPARLVVRKEELARFLARRPVCVLVGYGGTGGGDPNYGTLRATLVQPEAIELRANGLLFVRGIGGWNSGLVEGGDSGGSLACRASKHAPWLHVANISARNYSHGSLLAPLFLSPELFAGIPGRGDLEAEARGEDSARLVLILREAKRELSSIERALARISSERLESLREDLEKASASAEGKILLKKISAAKREIVRASAGKDFRVLPFALVELDLSDFALGGPEMKGEFRAEKNPFSLGDQRSNLFTLGKVEGGHAVGKLRVFGHSDYFGYDGCRHNVICVPGEFRNVRVPLPALDPSSLR